MVQQVITQDALLLGAMQGKIKLGIELFAGMRAELMPTPVNQALSTLGGRMAARVMLKLMRDKSLFNYHKYRIDLLAEVIKLAMPLGKDKPVLVDAPSGFSPLGMTLATRFPHAQVLDMDLREIIQDKKYRLQRGRNVVIPPNISFVAADFRTRPVHQVLAEQGHLKIDVISFLSTPFSMDELIRLATYLRGFLTEQGAIVCFGPWKPAVQYERDASNLLHRQVPIEWKGAFQTKEQPIDTFKKAGYSDVKAYLLSDIPQDFIDADDKASEMFIIARR